MQLDLSIQGIHATKWPQRARPAGHIFYLGFLLNSARTACAMAIAMTQSSCAPLAAPVAPPSIATNVLHSPSSRLLENIHGDSTSSAPILLIIPSVG